MDVYVYFPSTYNGKVFKSRQGSRKAHKDIWFTLLYERQKELVDQAVIPALCASVPAVYWQEMPLSFDVAKAISKSNRETSGSSHGLYNS